MTLVKKKTIYLVSEMIVLIGKPAFHEACSGSSLYTSNETHEHILQFKKAEIKSELTENAPFKFNLYTHYFIQIKVHLLNQNEPRFSFNITI